MHFSGGFSVTKHQSLGATVVNLVNTYLTRGIEDPV